MDGFNALAFPDWNYSEGIASSHHFIPGEWNEVHPFRQAYRETDIPGLSIGIGQFLNSEDNNAFLAGLRGDYGPFWAEGGLATGYSGAPVVPFGRVGVDLGAGVSAFAHPAFNVDTGDFGPVFGLGILNRRF